MLVGQTVAAERWGLDTGGIDRVNEWRGIARTDIKRDEFERRGREGGRGGRVEDGERDIFRCTVGR